MSEKPIILFDFWWVVINHKTDECIFGMFESVANWAWVDAKTIRKFWNQHVDPDHMAGKITYQEVAKRLENKFGKRIFNWHEEVIVGCMRHAILHQEVVDYIVELKEQWYKVGLLSDMNKEREQIFMEKWRYKHFDPLFNSCHTGYSKAADEVNDTTEIYEYVLEKLQVSWERVIFIDDKLSNLTQAKKVGILTLHAQSPYQIVTDLKAMIKNNLDIVK